MVDLLFQPGETVAMEAQSAASVLLVRPAAFGFNSEGAKSNVFAHSSDSDVGGLAQAEFDRLAARLSDAGVEVLVLEDTAEPSRPDAVFPNNWVSFHADGTMVLYPMATEVRRLERRAEALQSLVEATRFQVRRVIDLTSHENAGRYLEGTGSLVLDRPRHEAYATLGPRTDAAAIADFDAELGYSTFVFDARDPAGRPIYHTNVMLSLGTKFAVVCLEAVALDHRTHLLAQLEESGRKVVKTTFAQLRRFGCNVLELRNSSGDPVIAMSAKALSAFNPDQVRTLESFGEIVAADIPTIEAVGGGGVRCMIAEVHLPRSA